MACEDPKCGLATVYQLTKTENAPVDTKGSIFVAKWDSHHVQGKEEVFCFCSNEQGYTALVKSKAINLLLEQDYYAMFMSEVMATMPGRTLEYKNIEPPTKEYPPTNKVVPADTKMACVAPGVVGITYKGEDRYYFPPPPTTV